MDTIFVDTGAFFAATTPWDAKHAAAIGWLGLNTRPLMTTDYVVDETLTLLKARGEWSRAIKLGAELFGGAKALLHYLTVPEIQAAWQVFQQFRDKEWSFTDCTSKVVMEKLGITTAFSFDHHFRQFGSVTVVP